MSEKLADRFTDEELLVLLECAHTALGDADIYQDLAEHLDLSDDQLKALHEKLHNVLEGGQ